MKKIIFLMCLFSCKPRPAASVLQSEPRPQNASAVKSCEYIWKVQKGEKACWFYLKTAESCSGFSRAFVMKAFEQKGLSRTTEPVATQDILQHLRTLEEVEKDLLALTKTEQNTRNSVYQSANTAKYEDMQKYNHEHAAVLDKIEELKKEKLAISSFKNASASAKIDLYHSPSTAVVVKAIKDNDKGESSPASCQYLEIFK